MDVLALLLLLCCCCLQAAATASAAQLAKVTEELDELKKKFTANLRIAKNIQSKKEELQVRKRRILACAIQLVHSVRVPGAVLVRYVGTCCMTQTIVRP
jgi:hypothetical protein